MEDELKELLRRERALALRFTTPMASCQGAPSYDVVLEQERYDLRAL